MNMSAECYRTFTNRRRLALGVLLLSLLPAVGLAQEDCIGRGFKLGHPVDDYRDRSSATRHHLNLVEQAHFTTSIEQLQSAGIRSGSISGNIDYTLRRFPNHHRALYAISRYWRQQGGQPSPGSRNEAGFYPSAECYLQRAVLFAPDDPTAHMIYGIHLHLTGHLQEALKQYRTSEKLYPNSPELHYNLGLLYFDLGEYGLAKQHAQQAYRQGYPLPGLKNKLAKIDRWP